MKIVYTFVFTLISILFVACGSDSQSGDQNQIVHDFLDDIHALENVEKPIESFIAAAEASADKVMSLDKENVADVFEQAKKYDHCVIVTGNHTIVLVDDFENCKSSGSWGACMPFAEGFIKKGDLVRQKDYINNIIGRPDTQKRTVYFFE